jgi:hypothetical protein
MLKLLKPTTNFKVEQAKYFIKVKNDNKDLLPQCLQDPTKVSKDLFMIHASLFKTTYKEMAWLLARVLGQESNSTVPCMALYILYYSIQWKIIFDWSKIISSKISFQRSNVKKYKNFYIFAYLVFTIVYCHVFLELNLSRQVDSKVDLVVIPLFPPACKYNYILLKR